MIGAWTRAAVIVASGYAIALFAPMLVPVAYSQDGPGDTCRALYNNCLTSGGAREYCRANTWNPCMLRKCNVKTGTACIKDAECQLHCVEIVTGGVGQNAAVSCCSAPSAPENPVNQACRQMIQMPSGLRCVSDAACPTGMTSSGSGCVPGSASQPGQTPTAQPGVPETSQPIDPLGGYGDIDSAVPDFNPPVDEAGQVVDNAALLDRYANQQLDQYLADNPRPPIITEGSLPAWSQFDQMMSSGQIDAGNLADYVRENLSPGGAFNLDTFLAPEQLRGPFYEGSFYEGASRYISPTPGTFNPGSINPFALSAPNFTGPFAPPPPPSQGWLNSMGQYAANVGNYISSVVQDLGQRLGLTTPPVTGQGSVTSLPDTAPVDLSSLAQDEFRTGDLLVPGDAQAPLQPGGVDTSLQRLQELAGNTPGVTLYDPAGARVDVPGSTLGGPDVGLSDTSQLAMQWQEQYFNGLTADPAPGQVGTLTYEGCVGITCTVGINEPWPGYSATAELGGPMSFNPYSDVQPFTTADVVAQMDDGSMSSLGPVGSLAQDVWGNPFETSGPTVTDGPTLAETDAALRTAQSYDDEMLGSQGTIVDEFPESATEKPPEVAYQEQLRGAEQRLQAEMDRVADAERALRLAQENDYPLRNMYDSARCATGMGTCTGVPAAEAALAEARAARDAAAATVDHLRDIPHSNLARLQAEIDANLTQAELEMSRLNPSADDIIQADVYDSFPTDATDVDQEMLAAIRCGETGCQDWDLSVPTPPDQPVTASIDPPVTVSGDLSEYVDHEAGIDLRPSYAAYLDRDGYIRDLYTDRPLVEGTRVTVYGGPDGSFEMTVTSDMVVPGPQARTVQTIPITGDVASTEPLPTVGEWAASQTYSWMMERDPGLTPGDADLVIGSIDWSGEAALAASLGDITGESWTGDSVLTSGFDAPSEITSPSLTAGQAGDGSIAGGNLGDFQDAPSVTSVSPSDPSTYFSGIDGIDAFSPEIAELTRLDGEARIAAEKLANATELQGDTRQLASTQAALERELAQFRRTTDTSGLLERAQALQARMDAHARALQSALENPALTDAQRASIQSNIQRIQAASSEIRGALNSPFSYAMQHGGQEAAVQRLLSLADGEARAGRAAISTMNSALAQQGPIPDLQAQATQASQAYDVAFQSYDASLRAPVDTPVVADAPFSDAPVTGSVADPADMDVWFRQAQLQAYQSLGLGQPPPGSDGPTGVSMADAASLGSLSINANIAADAGMVGEYSWTSGSLLTEGYDLTGADVIVADAAPPGIGASGQATLGAILDQRMLAGELGGADGYGVYNAEGVLTGLRGEDGTLYRIGVDAGAADLAGRMGCDAACYQAAVSDVRTGTVVTGSITSPLVGDGGDASAPDGGGEVPPPAPGAGSPRAVTGATPPSAVVTAPPSTSPPPGTTVRPPSPSTSLPPIVAGTGIPGYAGNSLFGNDYGAGYSGSGLGGAAMGAGNILQGLALLGGLGSGQPSAPAPYYPPSVIQPPPPPNTPIQPVPNTPPPLTLPSIAFTASPNSIPVNGTAKLSWTALRATSCELKQGSTVLSSGGTTGNFTPQPLSETTSFALTCAGDQGSRTANVTVYVGTPAPATTQSQTTQPAPTITATSGTGGATSGTQASGASQNNWCDPAMPTSAFIACLENLPGGVNYAQ